MKVHYSPIVDADLQVAFNAQSCRAVGAEQMAEDFPQSAAVWREAQADADRLAEKVFPVLAGEQTSACDALDQMIEYEMYKATELYLLFAKEARFEGFPEIAERFEEAARTAQRRWKAMEELKALFIKEELK